jgi:hypothetical protein
VKRPRVAGDPAGVVGVVVEALALVLVVVEPLEDPPQAASRRPTSTRTIAAVAAVRRLLLVR